MRLNCKRISLRSDGSVEREWIEVHKASVQWHESLKSWWIKLEPGVTGYESAEVKDILRDDSRYPHWTACAGTPGSWDRLVVPELEMERLKDTLRLLPFAAGLDNPAKSS